jgi:hypothetical protein
MPAQFPSQDLKLRLSGGSAFKKTADLKKHNKKD